MADPAVEAFLGTITIVERAVAEYRKAIQGVSALDDYAAYRTTIRSAESALELSVVQVGAAIRDKDSATAVRLAGIRSTSTEGLAAALRHWLTAARKRLLAEPAAADPFNPHGSGPVPIEPREQAGR